MSTEEHFRLGTLFAPREQLGAIPLAPQTRWDRVAPWAAWAAAALGVALRARQYANDRSLWEDEGTIATVITHTSAWRLVTHPLPADQAAPAAWILLEKLAITLFGTSELSFRLWPFVFSLLLLGVTPLVARKVLSPWAASAATLLIAVSPQLIYYSSETKPYGSDALAVLVILYVLLSEWIWERNSRAVLGGVVIAAMCWLAFPAVFVAPCAIVVFAVVRWRKRQSLAPLVLAAVIVAVNLLVNFFVVLRPVSRNDSLHAYWQNVGGFPPAGASPIGFVRWLIREPINVLHFPGQFDYAPLAFALVLLGLAVGVVFGLWRASGEFKRPSSWVGPVLLVVALLAGLAVAAASKYPLAIRVALWSIPLALILAAGVLQAPRVVAVIGAALILVVSASSIARGVEVFATPLTNDDSRGDYAFVAAHYRPGDIVAMNIYSLVTYAWYQKKSDLGMPLELGVTRSPKCTMPVFLHRHAGDRLWLVFGHHPALTEPADSYQVYLSYFRRFGTLEASWTGSGPTAAYLIVISDHPPTVVHQRWWGQENCPTLQAASLPR